MHLAIMLAFWLSASPTKGGGLRQDALNYH